MSRARSWLAPAALCALFGLLHSLERRRPLRLGRERWRRRFVRNFSVGAITAVAVRELERPLTLAAAEVVERRRLGLVPQLPLPASIRTALALVLLDYSLYCWHVLLHRVPILWRCHAAHHADRDLDVSTALRFHFAEFVLSVPWRLAQIRLIGVTRRSLSLWSALTVAEVMFHHSNLRLPHPVESVLSRVLVTPRMHGIHHSIVRDQRNSNFSSGLALWDFLHATFRLDVPQCSITVGLPDRQRPADVTLVRTLALPLSGP